MMHDRRWLATTAWILCLAAATGCSGKKGGDDGDVGPPDGVDFDMPWDGEDIPPVGPPGWVVFLKARDLGDLPMGANLLENPDLEAGNSTTFDGWSAYEAGYGVDTSTSHSPERSARLANAAEADQHGLYQHVTLDQTEPRPLYVAGWSRGDAVTGEENNDYAIYLDIEYTDGTPLYGQTVRFAIGTHDWTFGETVIVPDKPIASLSLYLLLRRTHAGTAWFDDLELREVQTDVYEFDGELVYTEPMDPWPFEGSAPVEVASTGPRMVLSAAGGAITSFSTPAAELAAPGSAFASGLFVRDVAGDSDFIHLGGTVTAGDGTATHAATEPALGLAVVADFAAHEGDVHVDVALTDLTGANRALTLYFALPLAFDGWTWGDDIRTSRTVEGGGELSNTFDAGFGANGRMSRYPFASVAGTDGISLGYPLDRPAAIRLAANPRTHLLYAAVDVALSPLTPEPGRATVELVIDRHDPEWGFRAAARRLYDHTPEHFAKRVDREGLWVAFSDLDPLPGIDDFGIAFHEMGSSSQIAFDDGAGVLSFRYLTEPWSYWMDLPTTVPNDDEAQVLEYLNSELTAPEEQRRRYAEATLSSCSTDEAGHFRFEPAAEPWCPYGAVFTLNPDPDIADPEHPLNKGLLAWNDDARAIYTDTTVGTQDGEYLDSLEARATVLDYRDTHLAASSLPLVYDAEFRPAVPEMWATYEFAAWLEAEIHGMGKLMMANGALLRFAFPAHLFDVMGNERDWLWSGEFRPDTDETFNFWRTLSSQKPYCTLMNTDFAAFDHAMVERYFRISLFYGVYPSMFSHNASEDRYWDDPALYERDRDLFILYVPLIREIGESGWEPVTHARSSGSEIYVERWGAGATLRFTVRSVATDSRSFTLTIDAAQAGLPAGAPATFVDAISGTTLLATPSGSSLVISDTLDAEGVRLLRYIP